MIGVKSDHDLTFLTDRAVLCSNVTAAQTDLDALTAIRLDLDVTAKVPGTVAEYAKTGRGGSARLCLFVRLTGGTGHTLVPGIHAMPAVPPTYYATIRVWLRGNAEVASTPTPPDAYYLFHEQVVSCPTLIDLRDLPATACKVSVSAISNGESVTIIYQRSA